MKITIEVSDDLYRRAKVEAALRGRKLKDLVGSLSQPFSVSSVARRTTVAAQRNITTINGRPTEPTFSASADTFQIYDGDDAPTVGGVTDGSTYSIQALYSNAASKICINGSSSTVSIATTNSSGCFGFLLTR